MILRLIESVGKYKVLSFHILNNSVSFQRCSSRKVIKFHRIFGERVFVFFHFIKLVERICFKSLAIHLAGFSASSRTRKVQ